MFSCCLNCRLSTMQQYRFYSPLTPYVRLKSGKPAKCLYCTYNIKKTLPSFSNFIQQACIAVLTSVADPVPQAWIRTHWTGSGSGHKSSGSATLETSSFSEVPWGGGRGCVGQRGRSLPDPPLIVPIPVPVFVQCYEYICNTKSLLNCRVSGLVDRVPVQPLHGLPAEPQPLLLLPPPGRHCEHATLLSA